MRFNVNNKLQLQIDFVINLRKRSFKNDETQMCAQVVLCRIMYTTLDFKQDFKYDYKIFRI